jgi:hypothetical protein
MKTLCRVLCTILIIISSGCKENTPTAVSPLSENKQQYPIYGVGVELLSRGIYDSYYLASFNFRYATRDDSIQAHNRDFLFSNGTGDNNLWTFDKNRIADVGVVQFENVTNVSIASNFVQKVSAKLGHVYVVHVSDDDGDYYAKLKITSLTFADKMTFNWVRSKDGVTFEPFVAVTDTNIQQQYATWGIGAELFSRQKYNDYFKATFSFEFSTQGDNSITYGDWDILYDNFYWIISSTDTIADQIDVNTVTDDRSAIADLGIVDFESVKTVPLSVDYTERVRAITGHVYIVHTKDTNSDLYIKFIVTAMKQRDWIRVNWVCSSDGLTFKK